MSSDEASPTAAKNGDAMLLSLWAEWHEGTVSMATNDELSLEWSMLGEDCYTWDDSDLQLAAELGKTLLERNKELETGLKQQQSVIDDQSQEIEYLSKQTTALREVNDSRLRVYEQLEVSIQDLETTNHRLQTEARRDKQKIRSLSQNVDVLESRCAELLALVDELRSAERQRRRLASLAQQAENSPTRKQLANTQAVEELRERLAETERQLSESRDREGAERQRRTQAEAEVGAAQQECSELRQEMALLRERSFKLHALAEEVHALEEHRLSPFMSRACVRPCSRASSVSPQVSAPARCPETEPEGAAEAAVWDQQIGVGCWAADDAPPSQPPGVVPAPDLGSAPASLISDLDSQYRHLLDEMDKYESLLSARHTPRPLSPVPHQPGSLTLLQELQMSAIDGSTSVLLDGASVPRDSGPESLMMLVSDGDASSGFSEGDSRTVSRATQTPDPPATAPPCGKSGKLANGTTSVSPLQPTPQYKQLFQQIFDVLNKKPVVTLAGSREVNEAKHVVTSGQVTQPVFTAQLSVTSCEFNRVPRQRSPVPVTQVNGSGDAESTVTSAEVKVAENSTLLDPAGSPPAETLPNPSDSAPKTFSYAEVFERLKAADSCLHHEEQLVVNDAVDGEVMEDFPHLMRPSQEVAKLRLLERSYAEALKVGMLRHHRPGVM